MTLGHKKQNTQTQPQKNQKLKNSKKFDNQYNDISISSYHHLYKEKGSNKITMMAIQYYAKDVTA